MAAVNRQDPANPGAHLLQPPQNQHHLQFQRHQTQSPANPQTLNNPASSAFRYPDANDQPQQSDVDFSAYIRDDGSGGYNPNWDNSHIPGPQTQPNGFGQQQQSSWDPHHQSVPNSLNSAGHGFISADYVNPFSQASNGYTYPSYHGNQYQGYPGVSYPHNLGLGAGQYFNDAAFTPPNDQSFGNHAAQEQTISPSALQSYPNAFQAVSQKENQPPHSSQIPTLAPKTQPKMRQPPLRRYDDQLATSLARGLPKGAEQGKMTVKDAAAVCEATNSKKFAAFVFIGLEKLNSEEQRSTLTLPRVTPRRSLKELRKQVREGQGDRPWTPEQRPLLKRLKLKSAATKTTKSLNASAQASASSESSAEASSDDASDDDSDSDEEMEPEPAIISQPRSNEPVKEIEYDVAKIIWAQPKLPVPSSSIKAALGKYWELVKPVRDDWKAEVAATQAAEAKNLKGNVDRHKSLANDKRKLLEHAFKATADYGHPDIVANLTENQNLVLCFHQLLADRFKESDFNGQTVINVLKLILKCTPITQALFEKTKLDKVLPKLLKRGNESVKSLVQEVLDHTTKVSKSKASIQEQPVTHPGLAERAQKRPSAPVPEANAAPSKKLATQVAGLRVTPSTGKDGPSAKASAGSKPNGKVSETAELAAASTAAKAAVAKPSAYAGLLSASKKPGASMASQKAQKPSESKKAIEIKKPSRPSEGTSRPAEAVVSKPAFSFAETMASLNKPKEAEIAKKASDDRPPETEEEKKKRLRKEARRHLRVKWKPEAALVETRLFTHDPDEELDMDHDAVRADLRNEGKMLKAGMGKNLEDEEEDEELANGVELMPWRAPSVTDFSEIQAQDGTGQNLVGRGGIEEVRSAEKEVQRQREMNTLIAIYTSRTEIPDTPREPSDPFSGPSTQEVAFGEPPEKIRGRDAEFRRLHNPQPYPQNYATPGMNPTTNVASLLQMLNTGQQQAQPAAQPAQQNQPALEAIFSQFAHPPAQMPAPQAQPTPPIDPSFQAILSVFNQQQNQPQPSYTPAPAVPQTPNLSNILAQISQQQQQPQMQANPGQAFNYQNQYQQDSRKRPYDNGQPPPYDQGGENKRGKTNTGGKKHYSGYTGVPIVPCRFYQEGKCKKGKECTFLHE